MKKLLRLILVLALTVVIAAVTILAHNRLGAAQQPPPQSPQMQAAMQLLGAQKWAEAATAFETIVKAEPNNGRAWYMLGTARHSLGQYEKAAEAYEKNIPISNNPNAMYNLACAYARLNQKDKAFAWIEKAIAGGVAGNVNIETDEDLKNLHGDARFKKTVELAARQQKPCLFMAEARQFDFWLGEWDVFPSQAPVGQVPRVGESKIDNISEGCGLLENWTATGNNGKSINYYDSTTGKWYQHWIGSGSVALRYEGSFKDNAMRFEGVTIDKEGKKTLNRLTFFKLDENTVRQFAELSTDDGKTWTVSYDFRYERKKTNK